MTSCAFSIRFMCEVLHAENDRHSSRSFRDKQLIDEIIDFLLLYTWLPTKVVILSHSVLAYHKKTKIPDGFQIVRIRDHTVEIVDRHGR